MTKLLSHAFFGFSLAAFVVSFGGCNKPATGIDKANNSTPVASNSNQAAKTKSNSPPNDDSASIEKLASAGFRLVKDDQGNVRECTAARQDDSVELFGLLKGLRSLKTLQLSGPGTGDAGLDVLGELKQLERIDLSESAITDKSLDFVGGLTKLTTISLRKTGITDNGLKKHV